MLVYVLAVLLQNTPISVFAHVQYYDTESECQEAAKKMREVVPAEKKNSVGCLVLVVNTKDV